MSIKGVRDLARARVSHGGEIQARRQKRKFSLFHRTSFPVGAAPQKKRQWKEEQREAMNSANFFNSSRHNENKVAGKAWVSGQKTIMAG